MENNEKKPIGAELHSTSCSVDNYIKNMIKTNFSFSITIIEEMTLEFIKNNGGKATMKEIIDFSHCAKASVSQIIKSLHKKGLIEVDVKSDDKRIKDITISNKGNEVIDKFSYLFSKITLVIEKDFTEGERECFYLFMSKIRKNIGLNY